MPNTKHGKSKTKRDADPSMWATNVIIFSLAIPIISIASLYVLQQDVWVKGESSWLISRAAAMAAFVVLTLLVVLGLVLSHPRNKDTWRWTPKLLPWHQALMVALFLLLGMHIFFTVTDPKSGVTAEQMWYPIHARYYPIPMVFGAMGLYSLLIVSVSVGIRKWVRWWLPIHRASWVTWIAVFIHGVYGGSDTRTLFPLYVSCAVIVAFVFFWRHWSTPKRLRKTRRRNRRTYAVQNEARPWEGA